VTVPMLSDGVTPVDFNAADATYASSTVVPTAFAGTTLVLSQMSVDEEDLFRRLSLLVSSDRYNLQLRNAYYEGTARIRDLGISIPPQMRQLHTALGWPRVAVESVEERINLDGFRYPSSSDADQDLQDIWLANDMDSEHNLANLDALVYGRGFITVGSPDEPGDAPLITVESPLDMAVDWDPRSRRARAALRLHGSHLGGRLATLYLPDQTLQLELAAGAWVVTARDQHNLGVVPVVRVPNRARSNDRDGTSDITAEIMSLTDAACRTLQGLEVAREFYAAPQRYFLGVNEGAFQNADGTTKSALETYLGRVLAFERDEDGNAPTVGQFTPYDPSTFTNVIDMYAKLMSSITGLPPHVLGYTTDNPASADAIRSSEMRLKLRADRKTSMWGPAYREVMTLSVAIRDGKSPDPSDEKISVIWGSTATPTLAATTDAVMKMVTMGALPPQSDVTLEMLGFNGEQRARIEVDRATDQGASLLNEVAHSLLAKDARVNTTVANNLIKQQDPTAPDTTVPPSGHDS
jgi:hypothetical protein